ncbi:MAG: glycosyltransferase [Kiloniellales bacterium]|nr:glycosyltransferase [Kiloniellales bacterium]
MICILHGYLLEGSGSNLWTRAIVQALCRQGAPVLLVCQEPHPEIYDFIAAAHLHEPDGSVTTLFERDTPYPGTCVLHKPRLGDTLPVYVGDIYEEFTRAVPMVELPDTEIEAYLERNHAVLRRLLTDPEVAAVHANHAVLMSVVAERACVEAGLPFSVMPHGSAIEYAVKVDPRFHALAASAFARAGRIFVHGPEMRRRVLETFPKLPDLDAKIAALPLGVDTRAFRPSPGPGRPGQIAALRKALASLPRGREPQAAARLQSRLRDGMSLEALTAALEEARGYDPKRPDGDAAEKLAALDWTDGDQLLFVGRLIASKGPQNIVAALPRILEARPKARLVVVGHGPLREVLEALVWALSQGRRGLVRDIVAWGRALEGGPAAAFEEIRLFFAALEAGGELEAYFEAAERLLAPERVVFTGYLTHAELKHLLPCCDVGIFPSIVAEAGPLVFLEALASGCFPLGTDFAGTAATIESLAEVLPAEATEGMKLRVDKALTVADIVDKATAALALEGRYRDDLRRAAEARYDWTAVAGKLAAELAALAQPTDARQ